MSVCSDGKHYDVPEGLIFSFPVTVKNGKWEIVEGLELDARSKEFFAKTIGKSFYHKEIIYSLIRSREGRC